VLKVEVHVPLGRGYSDGRTGPRHLLEDPQEDVQRRDLTLRLLMRHDTGEVRDFVTASGPRSENHSSHRRADRRFAQTNSAYARGAIPARSASKSKPQRSGDTPHVGELPPSFPERLREELTKLSPRVRRGGRLRLLDETWLLQQFFRKPGQ